MFAVVTEITSMERCEGEGGTVEKLHTDTVCTGLIRSVTPCVQGEGGAERVNNAEKVLQENSPEEMDKGSGSVY